jgi:hypothetical protein
MAFLHSLIRLQEATQGPQRGAQLGTTVILQRDLIELLRDWQRLDGAARLAYGATPPAQAARDVLAERRRQVDAEGYDPEHDDAHPNEEIAAYAALYAMPPAARDWPATESGYGETFGGALCPVDWHPKFGDRRRELVKAAALLLAEIERIDRAASKTGAA